MAYLNIQNSKFTDPILKEVETALYYLVQRYKTFISDDTKTLEQSSEFDKELGDILDRFNQLYSITSQLTEKELQAIAQEFRLQIDDIKLKLQSGYFKGDKGDPFLFIDFTEAQLASLKVKGDKGDPFLYTDFTQAQLNSLINIHSQSLKLTLVDADEMMLADSASTFSLKRITWASIKTVLSSMFTPRVTTTTINTIPRYSDTTGTIKSSTVTVDDSGLLTAPGGVNANSSTATKLQTSRNINGRAFDGSANIDIEDRLGANIASSATTIIGTIGLGDYIHITGTTTITSFGIAGLAGIRRTLIFDGALTLTHNATSLICPGSVNIPIVAGTIIEVVAETTANWRVVSVTHPQITFSECGFLSGLISNIQQQLNTKAPSVSPAFTGTPTAPTPTSTDNSTTLVTTAWSKLGLLFSIGSNGYFKFPDWLGGFIFQWGTVLVSQANTFTTFTFPLTFPNSAGSTHVFTNVINSGASNVMSWHGSPTSSNVSVNASSVAYVDVFAIGW